jgi:pimeloyl-ACP methyl ester carboxylesterase
MGGAAGSREPAEARARRQELRGLLGDLPAVEGPVQAAVLGEEERESYVLQHLVLDLNGIERVPAYFTRPRGVPAGARLPAILFNHSHAEFAKDELLRAGNYMPPQGWAEALARRGICALAIDAWNFGERRGRTESELFKEMLWRGQVLWGMMVFDALRALDYLSARHDVDPGRIGTLGMSMGSTMAWWVAALDPRVRVCVDICCLTDFETLVRLRGLDGHGIYYYVPRLLRHFSTAEINALIAPRPHLSLAGNFDKLTPPEGLEAVDRQLRAVYAGCAAPEAWRLSRHDVGHVETRAMRHEALAFLDRWL